MKTILFEPKKQVGINKQQYALQKVKDEVLEEEFKKAVGYQAKRNFYTNFYINPSFMKKYTHDLDWQSISRHQPLSATTIKKYAHLLSWEDVSEFQHLSDDILWKYRNRIDWFEASDAQTLSEDMIRKLIDYVDWDAISASQKMSLDFMLEMRDKLDLGFLEGNPHLSEQDYDNFLILCKLT